MADIQIFKSADDLKKVLATTYQKTVQNYFGGDEKKTLRFMTGFVAAWQKNPRLQECTPMSTINSFLTMASLELMPSDVSGEAYVIPFKNKGVMEAQFQLGYQGLVTLFYRAGAKSIIAELVYEHDEFQIVNGQILHTPDVFADDRGAVKGAYVIIELGNGGKVSKVMSKREILEIGETFSKSFNSEYSPWNPKQDPQGWMLRKTVLKQAAKLVPKNDSIVRAIAEDNKDSIISDRENDVRELPAPPMEPYKVERKKVVAEDEAGGGGAKVEERHQEAEEATKEPVISPTQQRMKIFDLLKKKHKFIALNKSEEVIAEKIMNLTGISYGPENYIAIIKELEETAPSGIKYGN